MIPTFGPSPKKKRVMHPNSIANLKPPWPKGQSGGHTGCSLKARLRGALEKNDFALARQLVDSTIEGAIAREVAPFHEVWDRVEGKVTDTHKIEGDIVIEVVYRGRAGGEGEII